MDKWQDTFLGLKQLPRELSAFELEAFFTFSEAELRVIKDRRGSELQLGLALQIGFLRMSGRLLDAVRIVPPVLWRHLGEKFSVPAPDLASLRAMYRRAPTLIEHQQLACEVLGFRWLSEQQRRALMQALRQELTRTFDRQQLLVFARRWLYDHRLIIMHERSLRSTIASATRQYEAALAKSIHAVVDDTLLERWRKALVISRESGLTQQTWLWAAPAKHSTRQIDELLERIEVLYELKVQHHLIDVPDDLVRRYARHLANRPPAIGARIKEPARTIEVACFLRYCLLVNTDRLLLMVRRRVADVWQHATRDAKHVLIHWADLYRDLLGSMQALAADTTVADSEVRERVKLLVTAHQARKPPTRAQLVRKHLIAEIRPVRSLLSALMILPWQAAPKNPVLAALQLLKGLYAQDKRALPIETTIDFGRVWKTLLADEDREQAFRALEVATLSSLRRALRNGSVWIDHSVAFRSREKLFIPASQWQRERNSYYRRLSLPKDANGFIEPLIERVKAGVEAVSQAAKAGTLTVDDEIHLTQLAAEEEDPALVKLRLFRESGIPPRAAARAESRRSHQCVEARDLHWPRVQLSGKARR